MMRIAIALACAGCITEKLIPCGDLVCAPNASCAAGRCIDPAAVEACQGRADSTPCTTPSLPSGVCSEGTCTTPGCGNGLVDPGEVCDDGNTIDGDGCSADCAVRDTCPPLGTAPHYGVALHLAVGQNCDGYAASGGVAYGLCIDTDGITTDVCTGPIDQPMTPIPSITAVSPMAIVEVRIVPEGDAMWVVLVDNMVFNSSILVYGLDAGAWVVRHAVTFPAGVGYGIAVGSLTRGPTRRVMIWDPSKGTHEYEVDANDVATDLGEVSVPGLTFDPNGVYLSPDGLRMVAYGPDVNSENFEFYSDRPTLAAPFGTAVPLVGVPLFPVPFVTPTCDRAYFTGFDGVYYVTQN